MKKQISFDYDLDTGLTIAQLKTKKGIYFGTSCKHPDDPFTPSYSVGTNIAEARANISLINAQIEDKKLELKGIKRLLAAMPEDVSGRKYAVNLAAAIKSEIIALKKNKIEYKKIINNAIEARKIYLHSRSMTREEKERMRNTIKASFEALSNQDKTTKESE